MIIFPAIDILGGRAVRLSQGDYARAQVYNENPLEQAYEFLGQGAEWLHVVDLDGAKTGIPSNLPLIKEIINETGLNVQVGGGIRTMEILGQYEQAGVARMVLGTALIKDPGFAREAASRFDGMIVAGIDARDGEVAVEGWCEGAGVPALDLARKLSAIGIEHLIYTDIARDGMQTGVDAEAYKRLADSCGIGVTASGGISSLEDIIALYKTGSVEGVICGRSLYEGVFTLKQALELVKRLDEESGKAR